MSDETGPALSRRALREQRRAEAEAQLAREAEALGRTPAPTTGNPPAAQVPAQSPATKSAVAPAAPAASVPAPKAPAPKTTPAVKPEQKNVAPAAKPVAAKPAAAKPAAAKPVTTKPASPDAGASAPKPAQPAAENLEGQPRSRRATDGQVDALPERASLQRARDREALRTRRRLEQEVSALSAPEPSAGDDPAPLTRKQLRLQMLKDAAGNAPAAGKATIPAASTAASTDAKAAPESAAAKPAANKNKPASDKPAAGKAPAAKPAPKAAQKPIPVVEQLSVEDALALRRRSGGGAPLAPAPVADDLGDVDLEVLAQQRELAARAAIISRRAAERQRLEESNTARAGARGSDPFTGAMHHLRDEDSERAFINTGISGPETRGIHISMTDKGTIVDAASKQLPTVAPKTVTPKNSAVSAPAPAAKPAEKPKAATPAKAVPVASKATGAKPAAAAAPAAKAPAKPGAAANKAAKPAPKAPAPAIDVEPAVSHPPVRAVRAQGLEPLDAQTAGMRRANNMYLMVIAALSVGGAALVAGLIMILNSN